MATQQSNPAFGFGFGSTTSMIQQTPANPPSTFNVFGNTQSQLFPSQNSASFFTPQNTPSHIASWTTPTSSSATSINQSPSLASWSTPAQNTTPITNTQDKGQIVQCLTESKNIQIEILKELKMLNQKNNALIMQEYVHTGVSCNGCMKPTICGIRYKCIFCKDFDFCEECEVKLASTHDPNHSFIKIKNTDKFNTIIQQVPMFNIPEQSNQVKA